MLTSVPVCSSLLTFGCLVSVIIYLESKKSTVTSTDLTMVTKMAVKTTCGKIQAFDPLIESFIA